MEPEGSLLHSQASATCPCPGPALSLITNIYYKKTAVCGIQTFFFFQNVTQEVFFTTY